ncbi:MAG: hypothetical protein ABIZ36_01060 [Gemmatimonadaceae bacterium]
MAERHFSDEEVAAIFEKASEAESLATIAPGKGMTLAALQEIGREAGMSPEAIARAAVSLDQTAKVKPQTLLGLPVAVGQTIEVDRPLSEADWERLVADLRVTFNARGVLRQDGEFRQWTNGNLQALVEPTPTGFRLRLKTFNANARGLVTMGAGGIAVAAVTSAALAIAGTAGSSGSVGGVALLGMLGAGMLGLGAMQLPSWARRRRAQMEEIVSRASLEPPTLPRQIPDDPGPDNLR